MGEVSTLGPLLTGSTQWALKNSSLIALWKAEERKEAFLPYNWQSLALANHRVSKNWCHNPLQRKEQDVLQNLRICFPHIPFQFLSPDYRSVLCGALDTEEEHQFQEIDEKTCFYPWLKNSDSEELLDFTWVEHTMTCEHSTNKEYLQTHRCSSL